MAFLVYLIIMIIMLVIADLTRPVPKSPKRPGIGDFEFPTADSTRKVPVVWGKPLVRGPNVTWYGNLKIEKIIKKVKGVFSDKKYTAGYMYYLGMHLSLCVSDGTVRLLKIVISGTDVAWEGNAGPGRYKISKWNLWGGDEQEGGVAGDFDWCPGGPAQAQNSYLRQQLGARVPAYRSTARLVWRGGYLGTSKYIKEWAVQVQRLPRGLASGYHDINGEANPAEMLYEILTEKMWGLGISNLEIELDSFAKAAKTLYDEKFGLSMLWDGSKTLRAISDDILAHIDGYMYVDVLTGRWNMGLNRQPTQAEIDALITLDQSCIKEIESFARPTNDETTNEVNVIWTLDGDTTKWPAKAQHLGLFQVHDKQFISVDVTYPGITNYELAQRVATRDLNTLSYPLVKVSVKVDRTAYKLRPGSRFKFTWAPLGIFDMRMVVLGLGYGTLDDNVISIDAVQDVFSLGKGLYQGGGSSGWAPIDRTPKPATNYRMEFTPYWLMYVDEEIENPQSAVPLLLVEAPSSTHLSYDVRYQDPTTGGAYATSPDTQPFTPTGTLSFDYLETPGVDNSGTLIVNSLVGITELPSQTWQEIQSLGAGLLVIDGEWLAYTSATVRDDGSYLFNTVYRGLLDTTVARHLAGAKVWFVSLGAGRTPTELAPFAAGTYRARLISRALGGLLPEESAPNVSLSTNALGQNARPLYAYPARDLTINGLKIPGAVANGPLVVAWKGANRLTETLMQSQDAASVTPEPGTVYRVFLYNDRSQLIAQSPDITTLTYTFNPVGGLPAAGYVQVRAVKASVNYGYHQAATLWFGLNVDYAGVADLAPQLLLEDSAPTQFLRMAD